MRKFLLWLLCLTMLTSMLPTNLAAAAGEGAQLARANMLEKMHVQAANADLTQPEGAIARATGIDYRIWDTDVLITLPGDAYEVTTTSTDLYAWNCPSLGYLVGFARSTQYALSNWQAAMEREGCATGSGSIGGVALVYGIGQDSSGYHSTFYFNSGSYSYSILAVGLTYNQALSVMDDVVSTIRLDTAAVPTATPTPAPTGTPGVQVDASGVVTGYYGTATEIVLPTTAKSIGSQAFKNSRITSIVIPDTVTEIGYSAFEGSKLTSVAIPSSVKTIGSYAFASCTSLASVTFEEGVFDLGVGSFSSCTALTSVTIPGSAEGVPTAMFKNCTALQEVTVLEGNGYLFSSAFEGCTALKTLVIPKSVTYITITLPSTSVTIRCWKGSKADTWAQGKGYPIVYLDDEPLATPTPVPVVTATPAPSQVPTLTPTPSPTPTAVPTPTPTPTPSPTPVPEELLALTQLYTIFDSDTAIYLTADMAAKNLTDTNAQWYSEAGHLNLFFARYEAPQTSLMLGTYQQAYEELGLQTGYYSLNGVTALVGFGEVTGTGYHLYCHYNANNHGYTITTTYRTLDELALAIEILNTLHPVEPPEPTPTPTPEPTPTPSPTPTPTPLPAFEVSADGSLTAYNGTETVLVIPGEVDGVTVKEIAESAFWRNGTLTSVVIPDTVERIGAQAFQYCENLAQVTLPEGLQTIGKHAFAYCPALESIRLPATLTQLGENAFYSCTGLKRAVIGGTDLTVAKWSFAGCTSLTCAEILDGVKRIERYAFYDCSALDLLILPETLSIQEAFASKPAVLCFSNSSVSSWAASLRYDIILRDGVYESRLVLPADVTAIDAEAFAGTDAQEIVLPDGCETIGERAFADQPNLRRITVPASVTGIAQDAFEGCTHFAIMGSEGSAAERYAAENLIPFIAQ